MKRILVTLVAAAILWRGAFTSVAQDSPTSEPSVRMLQKVIPAVVCITTEDDGRRGRNATDGMSDALFGTDPQGRRTLGTGSGFFTSADGYVVTNEHVVREASKDGISVTTQDGTTFPARLIQADAKRDLALLKVVPKEPFTFIRLDDLSPNLLGQSVFAIGNPKNLGMSVTRGILSARARTIRLGVEEIPDLVQTDVAINPGNSGGPIVDLSGKLVAVSCIGFFGGERQRTVGLNFGVAGNVVRMKIEEFLRDAGGAPKPKPKPALGPGGIPGL
ncbi:MAG: trypsin-like peptidase domain-containing protein [Chthoniobacteraceae bacterium]